MFKKARFEVVRDDCRKNEASTFIPQRATKHSVAYDIISPIDITIDAQSSSMIWTDIKAIFPTNRALLINVRSSMGKSNIALANTQGWVESDYANNESNDGNIGVMLHNYGNKPYVIRRGDKIAQCMLIRYDTFANGNTKTKRIGGFGSTGKKGIE